MKKSFFLLSALCAMLCVSCSKDDDATTSGIYYNFNAQTKEAEVTYNPETAIYQDEGITTQPSYSGNVTIPESVTSGGVTYTVTGIGAHAFEFCKISSVKIPNTVTKIGQYAFYSSELSSISLPNHLTTIGYNAFSGCMNLTSVKIPDTVTEMGFGAFSDCDNLASVTIGNSVKSIKDDTFYYCSNLTSVTIGSSVESIGSAAFAECTSLKSVTCLSSTPPEIIENTFDDCSFTLHVKTGCKSAYAANAYWSKYTIVEDAK